MIKYFLLFFLASPFLSIAQKASIQFNIQNAHSNKIEINLGGYTRAERMFGKEKEISITLHSGKAVWSVSITKPIFITAYYEDSDSSEGYSYQFYLTPGDGLFFSFDADKPTSTTKVTGSGSSNNQPALQNLLFSELDLSRFKQDSLPYSVLSAVLEEFELRKTAFNRYVETYKPSEKYRKSCEQYLQYYPLYTFLRFKGEQWFSARASFARNEKVWQQKEDSMLAQNTLSQESLLMFDEYASFLSIYLVRIKEKIWRNEALQKEYFRVETKEEVKKLMDEDPENILQERIIQKHFSGKTAEYLYGVLFQRSIMEKEDNLPEIYQRFKTSFPQSRYIPYLQTNMKLIENRRKRSLSADMIFVENNESFQSFDDILRLVKGKTVILDMWGTWCGPCRSEIILHSDSIKQHFKNQPLTFLYIANYDNNREKKWKELISFYGLTGIHILALQNLTKNILERVGGDGFPTYVIIKKDGRFELSKAGYPMNRQKLIEQIENALEE